MLVSLNSLSYYLPRLKNIPLQELIVAFNNLGFEVDEVINYEEKNTHVTIGKVIKCIPHPNADKLKVCTVKVGSYAYKIVCGASNVRKNIYVIIALNNAQLANVSYKIINKPLRGVNSEGMICSLKELGIDPSLYPLEYQTGIYAFTKDPRTENPFEALRLDGYFFDITIPSNRNDCNCMLGIVKELAAYFNVETVKLRSITELNSIKKLRSTRDISVNIENPKYASTVIYVLAKNVKVNPSNTDFQNYLISNKLNPINNIVDITNYVMNETGHPIHSYDASFFTKRLIIHKHKAKDEVECLGKNKKISLDGTIVVYNNKRHPAAVGGIVGLKCSSVTESTKDVLFEIINWNSNEIDKITTDKNISTAASKLFAKPISYTQTINAYNLLLKRLSQLKSRKYIGSFKLVYYKELEKLARNKIILEIEKLDQYLGFAIAYNDIIKYLELLNYEIVSYNNKKITILSPKNRCDISIAEDVIEDIIRLHGIDNVPVVAPYTSSMIAKADHILEKQQIISRYLANNNFAEIKTYSLVSKEKNHFNFFGYNDPITITNYSSSEHEQMRLNMFHSIFNNLKYNVSRQQRNFQLFELAKIHYGNKNKLHLAMLVVGEKANDISLGQKENSSIFYLKGIFIELLKRLNYDIKTLQYSEGHFNNSNLFHPYQNIVISCNDINVGYVAAIHPNMTSDIRLDRPAYYLEVNLTELFAQLPTLNNNFKSFAELPYTSKDFAFVVDWNANLSEIEEFITSIVAKNLSNSGISNSEIITKVFDIYPITDTNKTSCAFNVKWSTFIQLTDAIIKNIENAIITETSNKFDIILKTEYDKQEIKK